MNKINDPNLNPLQKALKSFEEILTQPSNKFIIAGVIQNFEFTFELAWKSMQRYLRIQGVETASPNQVLRAAYKEKIILDLELWLTFLKKRNLSVHTYNEDVAEEVYETAKLLPAEIKKLLNNLKSNN